MKNLLNFLMLVLLVGCSSKFEYLPGDAMKNYNEAVSVKHLVEFEKAGVKTLAVFPVLLDPGLLTETIFGGGVWCVMGGTTDEKIVKGYQYLTPVNWWGDFEAQAIVVGDESDLVSAKYAYFNRDAGYAYSLDGTEITDYDCKKFDQDKVYRHDFFEKYGKTLDELNELWDKYFFSHGVLLDGLLRAKVITVNGKDWANFRNDFAKAMPYNYKLKSGEIRSGYLPLDVYADISTQIPNLEFSGRLFKRASVPLVALPFSGAGFLAVTAASMAATATSASVDGDWDGYYARAKVLRYDLAPVFRGVVLAYKQLLAERDKEIARLKEGRYQFSLK